MSVPTRRGFAAILAGALVAGFAASAAAQVVIEERAMPALRIETIPPPPAPGYHWVPGHWAWSRAFQRWEWKRGHYVAYVVPAMPALIVETPPPPPHPHWRWVRGHWAWEGRSWVWRPGMWVR